MSRLPDSRHATFARCSDLLRSTARNDYFFQSFFATENFEDCLTDVVNRGGDADTTGAIAGMLAGACYGMESIPGRWLKALDQTTSKNCTDQALSLMALTSHH